MGKHGGGLVSDYVEVHEYFGGKLVRVRMEKAKIEPIGG